tara:strand:+ start:481 stop:1440 length:960 start_codon:yes stop_codon:yes gene_type:complete
MDTKITIIIPVKFVNDNLIECIENCLRLDYDNFEIIVLPDKKEFIDFPKIRVIPTGSISPSEKRDIGAENATGEILAFIDDDAYPAKDWLLHSIKHFDNVNVAAVGGPGVTPSNDTLSQKASGLVFSSFALGPFAYRYVPQKMRDIDDLPSCNMFVRKSIFEKLGGFGTDFWPGEDTKLCMDIIKKMNMRIVYDPNIIVYHHRRKLFSPHLNQVWRYAVYEGCFMKKFPELFGIRNRLVHLLPTFFVVGLIGGMFLAFVNPFLNSLYFSLIFIYLFLVLVFSVKSALKTEIKAVPLVFVGVIMTHLTYGFGVIKGMLFQ